MLYIYRCNILLTNATLYNIESIPPLNYINTAQILPENGGVLPNNFKIKEKHYISKISSFNSYEAATIRTTCKQYHIRKFIKEICVVYGIYLYIILRK